MMCADFAAFAEANVKLSSLPVASIGDEASSNTWQNFKDINTDIMSARHILEKVSCHMFGAKASRRV